MRGGQLPARETFYNKFSQEELSSEDYAHAQDVLKTLNISTLAEYLEIYLRRDIMLLGDVFENFSTLCKIIYKLDPAHYFTAPGRG